MARADFLTCPACDTRNRTKWQYCARCGASLADVASGAPASDVRGPSETPSGPAPAGAGLFPLVVVAACAVAAVWIWRSGWWSEPVSAPNPVVFAGPRDPSPVPVASQPSVPRPGHGLFAEGVRRLASGDVEGGIALLSKAVTEEPENDEYRTVHARALWDAKRTDEALTEMRAAAALRPQAHQAALARHLALAGRNDEAVREYETAARLDPNDARIPQELATLLMDSRQPQRAAAVLEDARRLRPADPLLRANLAYALEKSGNLEGATQIYQTLLDEDKGRAVARGRLAEVLFARGERENAVQVYRDGIALDANASTLRKGLGGLLEKSGQLRAAAAEYREYARLVPQAGDAKALSDRAALLEKKAEISGT